MYVQEYNNFDSCSELGISGDVRRNDVDISSPCAEEQIVYKSSLVRIADS